MGSVVTVSGTKANGQSVPEQPISFTVVDSELEDEPMDFATLNGFTGLKSVSIE